jgi:shikimate dehydrogenase
VKRKSGAVLGSPISHSLSPVLHRAAYDALGLADWDYRAVECDEESLLDTLRQLDTEGLAGVSLTMPLKRAVIPMLERVDDVAREVGGANTVLFGTEMGDWSGANTDVPGILSVLAGRLPAGSDGQTAAILGAGATAASAVAAISRLGVRAVVVFARRPAAAAELRDLAYPLEIEVQARPWDAVAEAADRPLVVSTTPAGSSAALAARLPRPPGILLDVIYSPWPTPLAAAWQAAGGIVIGGVELLIEQAADQVRLMTGREAPIAAMRAAGRAAVE